MLNLNNIIKYAKAANNLVFGVLVIALMISINTCRNQVKEKQDYENSMLSMQNMIDSVLALPPDTITKEVIIVKDSTIYVTTVIDSPKPEDVVQQYTDSIINDSIDLRVNILATKLFKINYEYKPIYKYQETVIEKKVPHYIETIKEIEVTKRQLYYGFGLAYGNSFGIKTGLLYTTKKNYALQYDYTLLDSHKFHSFTYFIKF